MFDGEDDQREKVEPDGAASETAQLRLEAGAVVAAAAAAAVAVSTKAVQVLVLREAQARGFVVEGEALAGEENSVAGYHEVQEALEAEAVQELDVGVVTMVSPLVVGENVSSAVKLTTLRTPGTPAVVNAGAQASLNGGING
jgi:hypothetical protein